MSQQSDGYLFLIRTLIRVAYAALVLGLGAIDARLYSNDADKPNQVQYNWSSVDRSGLACAMTAWSPLAGGPPHCLDSRPGSPPASVQQSVLRIFP